MSETLPKPPEVPPPIPDIELYAADLAVQESLQAEVEEPKEIDFERRNEIKDNPAPANNKKPMVPIAQVIHAKTQSVSPAAKEEIKAPRMPLIHTLPIVGPTPYAQPIALGFMAALFTLAVAAVTLL